VGLPLDALGVEGTRARTVRLADRLLSNLWPTMFGYQFIVEATPVRSARDIAGSSSSISTARSR
jgi:hypothetical protein